MLYKPWGRRFAKRVGTRTLRYDANAIERPSPTGGRMIGDDWKVCAGVKAKQMAGGDK